MTLVRIVKDWDWPNLLRQTPGGKGYWDDIHFTLDPVKECDYLLMLNNRMADTIKGKCPLNHLWMIIQEPYLKGFTDWVVEKHDNFAKVFTHCPPSSDKKYIIAPPAIPWHVNKTYDQLIAEKIPTKSKTSSWVVGNATDLPGHSLRLSFLKFIQNSDRELDLFGRAVQPIEDKWDGLAPYYFSMAIENNSGPDMWTEKLADCFLSWTVPIYYGCTNLEKYFPKESFISIDISDPVSALQIIQENTTPENWEKRLPFIEKARDLVLNKYQIFPFLAEQIHKNTSLKLQKESFIIPPYRRSIRARLNRLLYKTKKLLKN